VSWYHWLWLPVVAVIALLAYALGRGNKSLASQMSTELEVIDAKRDAKKAMATKGDNAARVEIIARFQSTIQQLNEQQASEAENLRHDPAALAAYLTRVSQS